VSDALIVLLVLGTGTFGLKAAGPLVLGGRKLPVSMRRLVDLLPAALLAALAAVATLADGSSLVVDARLVGLTVAGVALWRRIPFVGVVILASMSTAIVRLAT